MKRFCTLLLAGVLALSAAAREKVPAADSRITFVGRTLVKDGAVSFDWSGVYARVAFTGGYLALEAGDSGRGWLRGYVRWRMLRISWSLSAMRCSAKVRENMAIWSRSSPTPRQRNFLIVQ